MIAGAVLLPQPPLLLPGACGGVVPEVEELREACLAALRDLVAHVPDRLVLVAAGPGSPLPVPDGGGVPPLGWYLPTAARPPEADPLPLGLGLGQSLLEQAGVSVEQLEMCVLATDLTPQECARIGADLAAGPDRVALIVMGDGSARRRTTSPGYVDDRAIGFDHAVEAAVAKVDLPALLALPPALADELLVSGRPAWQVLAGALGGQSEAAALVGFSTAQSTFRTEIRYSGDPFGVWYLVASIGALA